VTEYGKDALVGDWTHSHEEDSGEEMVFRPASHAFPPSRGRLSLRLRADDTYVESSPGPVDAPQESQGRWALEGDRLVLEGEGERPGHAWRIAAVEADRLAVRKE
jgi:hypothetical protein